jgi:hypothetical protein
MNLLASATKPFELPQPLGIDSTVQFRLVKAVNSGASTLIEAERTGVNAPGKVQIGRTSGIFGGGGVVNHGFFRSDTGGISIAAASGENIEMGDGNTRRFTIDGSGGNIGIATKVFGSNSTNGIAILTGATSPSSSPADTLQLYSADIVAGNAALHTRTENGSVIKFYQQAHIADADGTLADITTRFNSLLGYLENLGFIATS